MMKIIIDIPKKVYGQICDENLGGIMATAIRCGKPLLKDTLPSAQPEQPEIIRCKDCKHGSPNGKYGCKVYHYKRYETHEMKPDDFCSRSERRTNE